MMRLKPLAALALAIPLVVCSGCVVRVSGTDYTAREEKRFAVQGVPEVSLVTFDGPIEVRAWARPEVLVEIEKSGGVKEMVDEIKVSAEQDGQRIRIEARRPEKSDWVIGAFVNTSRRVKLVATVPKQCNLMARTGDGWVKAEQVTGRIELRSGDGAVKGFDLEGDIHVDTADGSVKLEGMNGALDVRTGDGSVVASGRFTTVRARSGDGSISLKAQDGSTVSGAWDVSTADGGVFVYLPDSFDAEVDAATRDGVIRADRTFSLESSRDTDRRVLRGSLGRGGKVVRIRTEDGSINLRRL